MHLLWGPKQSAIGKSWQIPSAADISKLSSALFQPLWTTCISNSLSLYLIPPPLLPKDCFLLITVLELSSAILSCSVQQYTTFIIYELKHLQRLNGTQGIIQASHLYSRLECPNPSCSSCWCVWQPALPLVPRHTDFAERLTVYCQGRKIQ